jgi:hypothetical protein
MSRIIELYGIPTTSQGADWQTIVREERCPYLKRKCLKVRKSAPDVTIGTCSVTPGRQSTPIIICPFRLLERNQVFTDCFAMLTLHEPGNELHILPEIAIPGGNVDYFLASVKARKVKDFVGIELQTMDTTGTVWPERQRFLNSRNIGLDTGAEDIIPVKALGINWKMTAKTILMQILHKVETFEAVHKHLVLVIQDVFLDYMRREFAFEHLSTSRVGDPLHIYAYSLTEMEDHTRRIEFQARFSTDAQGIAKALKRQTTSNLQLEEMTRLLELKISEDTLLSPMTST